MLIYALDFLLYLKMLRGVAQNEKSRKMLVIPRLNQPLAGRPDLIRDFLFDLETPTRVLLDAYEIPHHDTRHQLPRIVAVRILLKAHLRARHRELCRRLRPLLAERSIRPPLHVRLLNEHEALDGNAPLLE